MQLSDWRPRRHGAAQGVGEPCCATCDSMWTASTAGRRTRTTALHCGDGGKGVDRACHKAPRWGGRGHPGPWMALGAAQREYAREGARGEAWGCQKLRHANRNEPQGKLPGPQRLRKSLFGFGGVEDPVGRKRAGERGRRGGRWGARSQASCGSFAPARWGWGSSAGTPPAFPRTPAL